MRQMMEEHADGQTFMEDGELFAYEWYTAPLTLHMCDTFLSEATEDEQGLVDILCEHMGLTPPQRTQAVRLLALMYSRALLNDAQWEILAHYARKAPAGR